MPVTWRVTLRGTYFGQQIQNVLHFRSDAGGQAQAEALNLAMRDQWLELIRVRLGQEVTYVSSEARNMSAPNDPTAILGFSKQGGAGGVANTFAFACFVLQVKTGIFGRKGRGRIYLPGLGPGMMSGGVLLPTVHTQWEIPISTLKSRFGPTASTGFKLGVAPRNDPEAFNGMIDLVLRSIPGVQRRRNIGVGI